MKTWRYPIVAILCLWMAGGCQQTLAPKIAIFDAVPDFLIVSVACLGLLSARYASSLVGFLAGVIHGCLAGANLAAYAISRTFTGFLTGWFNSFELEANVLVAFATTFVATLVAQLLLMFIAPPQEIGAFLLATIATAIYNGVIAVPVYALLKRIVDPPQR
ncbi:MAG: LytS/YhcK type 5TM receptor domain-containing protein [Fimbriimonas sp.]